ncbi:hypothetical protein BJX63DRAFT_435882 [Aspergillus granulosus]|uniref:C2H2-type domain-containing protein n=1 Tax=Aspergillus granulosus TaxID=176169 RepID=A0ABR4H0B5_9EURO
MLTENRNDLEEDMWAATAFSDMQYTEMLRLSDNDLNPDPNSIFSLSEPYFEVENPESPLERWRNSPPDIEPAHLDAIMRAVASSGLDSESNQVQKPSNSQGINAKSQGSSIVAGSERSGYSDSDSASTAYSFASNRSAGSFGRFYLTEPARRRRRRRTSSPRILSENKKRTQSSEAAGKRRYQCTFCTDTFYKKHDWTRHEKTLHLSLEKFTCSPCGPVYKDSGGTERCTFCDEHRPSEAHIASHRASTCSQRPITLRTFYRKDHLLQHLRAVHKTARFTSPMETWKSEATEVKSRCGFCAQTFTHWSDRNDHLAKHFRKGALMRDWKGCRGFEPAVALAVESAMPPYLIGNESVEMHPFSASNGRGSSIGLVEVDKPTPFEELTGHLTKYVDRAHAEGAIITDEMLQAESRFIVYGDEDPWNQTAADNPEWLRMFKEGIDSPIPVSAECPDMGTMDQVDKQKTTGDTPWRWLNPECLAKFRAHQVDSAYGPPDIT